MSEKITPMANPYEFITSMGLDPADVNGGNYDWRLVDNGRPIPAQSYADQPYIVKTDDNAWLCVLTTGTGKEGEPGQHVVAIRSTDQGKTWTAPVPLESPHGPHSSYGVPLKTPSGRIYCFYNHNTDNIDKVLADPTCYPDGYTRRTDSLGYFVFKYSDDHGRTWSPQRYPIDVREMEIDRQNPYGGKIRFFWNVGKPFVLEGAAYVPLHKIGSFGHGFIARSEGVLLKSDNLLTEREPERIRWQTLPDGDKGIRAPADGGPIAEEHSFVVLSDGSLCCVYRTVGGHPACCYSRDRGHTWSRPEFMRYGPNGRKIKHPRAANFIWKCSNGKYLYWFHNHGGRDYNDRNPVWLSCGVETKTPEGLEIQWSEPEIVLYADDPFLRMSYPDLVEEQGQLYLTETQKHTARIHRLDPGFMQTLFDYHQNRNVAKKGLILDIASLPDMPELRHIPKLPKFTTRDIETPDHRQKDLRNALTIQMSLRLNTARKHQNLLDNRTDTGKGFCVLMAENNSLKIILNDGRCESSWCSDPQTIFKGHWHDVAIIVDGGPKLILFIIDGKLCDGGPYRQFGWGRFSPNLRDINGHDVLTIGKDIDGVVKSVKLYDRAIMTAEAVANYRANLAIS